MSGTILYDPFIFQFFNVFYAAIPIIIFAVFDQELDSQFLEKNPEYYTPGLKDNYFNFQIFWGWFGSAVTQSIFIALIAYCFKLKIILEILDLDHLKLLQRIKTDGCLDIGIQE